MDAHAKHLTLTHQAAAALWHERAAQALADGKRALADYAQQCGAERTQRALEFLTQD